MYKLFLNYLLGLDRLFKNIILISTDYILLTFCFWLSLSLRSNSIYIPNEESKYLILFAPFIALPIFYLFGLYKSLVRYENLKSSIKTIMLAVSIYTLFWFFLVLAVEIVVRPYDFLIINWLVSIFFIGGIRFLAREILVAKSYYKKILIYGAGSAAIQLHSALTYNPEIRVIGFIDNDQKKQGTYISGIKVMSHSDIESEIEKKEVDEIFIAIPSLTRKDRSDLLLSLKNYSIVIRSIPSLLDLTQGKLSISDLKKIRIEDLLQREVRKPIKELLIRDIYNKNILVTGAGGSIGSELCRQIIQLKPKSLILFEISEASLYLIESELREQESGVRILAMIGNVTRRKRLDFILNNYQIETIYHAAAYKHVPLVEKNTIPGIRCNIFGTLTCIQAAVDSNVESFVFISTDKAVRPTNIMGATKRFAELILQAYSLSELHTNNTIRISMVRFGNVLGSSGSVVPLFRKQIEKGGPVTVTDPNIIRYFMTLEEAAQLVIQAGAMGIGGEIFLLDMGEPVYVLDLAKDMIRQSGMTILDNTNPDGDIEIVFTGLRPGEKLYEELLIGEASDSTKHEKIMKASEESIHYEELLKYLSELEIAIENSDFDKIGEIFTNTVSGYKKG